jgi:hypothetical protein
MQFSNVSFILGFAFLSLVAVVHHFALLNAWYYFYPWLDTWVHLIAGFSLGFFLVWLFLIRLFGTMPGSWSLYLTVAITVLVSLIWEWFELSLGLQFKDNFYFDTSLDVSMNITGALFANLIARKFFT